MHPMLNIAIQAARQAGKTMIRFVDRIDTLKISNKGPNDFVTEVDHIVEQDIIQTIQKAYPNHSIIAEETGSQQREDKYCWIIDPLDGTTNFIHDFPQFAVSIALTMNQKLEVAVVYDPLRQELFTATRGAGAHLNNRRIRVSQASKLPHTLLGTGFPAKDHTLWTTHQAGFQRIYPLCGDIRCTGSAALDLAYVACGRLDGYWEFGLKPWDMAAGALLVLEAGGQVSSIDGTYQYLKTGNIVASTTNLHPVLLETLS